MKKLLSSLCSFIVISCSSERQKEQANIDIVVIHDVTDPHKLRPEANTILGLFNLTENNNTSANFRYHEITDRMLVPIVSLHLPSASVAKRINKKNESFFRQRIILNFYDTIRKTLAYKNINPDSTFLNHSECFRTIAEELRVLAQSNSQNKLLLVYSNLFENSDIVSVYSDATKISLYENNVAIKKLFEKSNLLPQNLQRVKVFLLYQPQTREEDKLYLEMAEIYKQLLEPRGAKIVVQANNTFLN